MCLVDNQQVPQLCGEPAQHLGLLEEIDRRNDDRLDDPRIHVERQRLGERRERCRVQDRCANLESMPQLLGPLLPKPRGRDDERVLAPAALVQLREHEAGLNGLAEADLVGQEQSRGVPANQRQGRLELKRKDVYRGAERRPQLAEGPQIGSLRVQVAHPLSSRRRSDSVSASCRDRAVEWSEQAAAAERSLLVGVGQVEQRDVGERRRLLHDPSFASHRDAIAGGKGHALPRGNAHTVEKLPGMSGLRLQDGNSCPQMRRLIVKKLRHERVSLQGLLDNASLDSCPPAVNQPHLPQAGGVCFIQILFYDRGDVARREGV